MNRGSQSFKDTERFKRDFGGEAILVLVHGELSRTVLTADLNRVLRLEGCLGGNVPDNKKGLGSLPPVCRKIAELKPAKVVYGPATFINTAVGQIQDQLAQEAADRRHAGAAGRRGRAQALEAARRSALGAAAPCEGRRRCGPGAVHQRDAAARAQVRAQRHPADQRPDLRVRARVRPDRGRAGRAQVALRLPVPLEERGADPDPPAAGPHRGRAGARDRPDPGGDGGEGLQAPRRARATSSRACRWWRRGSPTPSSARSSSCSERPWC